MTSVVSAWANVFHKTSHNLTNKIDRIARIFGCIENPENWGVLHQCYSRQPPIPNIFDRLWFWAESLSRNSFFKYGGNNWSDQLKLAEDPPAFGPIHMLKYLSDFMYFNYQVMAHFMNNIGLSCGNTSKGAWLLVPSWWETRKNIIFQ